MTEPAQSPRILRFGMFEFDRRTAELRKKGIKIKVQGQPVDILGMLLERPGEMVTREELRAKLWAGDTFVDFEHSLNAAVNKLREALGDSADNPRFIETLPRRGYRFIAQLDGLSAPTPLSGSSRGLEKDPDRRYHSAKELDVDPRRVATPTAAAAEKSIAVLYFENLGGAKEDEYFRDGMTEDIITELANIGDLRVFPRSAMLAYRDKPVSESQVGQKLNAGYVLGGSLRRAGNRLRITAQLVGTRVGHTLWAKRYDRQLEDVFAIQDEIAQSIAQALQVVLTEKEKRAIVKAPTANVQAYDFYLRGRQYFYQWNRKSFEFARQMFARATAIDPGYARAYAGVADCCSTLYQFWEASEANLKEADAASRKALGLDPELAEAHVSRGMAVALNEQYAEAGKEFETAIRLNPNLYEAYYFYGRARFAEGKLEEAAQLIEQASRVNPDDYNAPGLLPMIYDSLGRKAEADAARRRALQTAEKHLELHPDDGRALSSGACALALLGQTDRALEWTQRALAANPEDPGMLYNVACNYALLGRPEEAVDCLEKAVDNGLRDKRWIEYDSELDSLRSHPRFQALLTKL